MSQNPNEVKLSNKAKQIITKIKNTSASTYANAIGNATPEYQHEERLPLQAKQKNLNINTEKTEEF